MVKSMLALDLGTQRVGVAASDELGMMAQPVTTLTGFTSEKSLAAMIDPIAKRYHAGLIVVGLPKRMDGSEGPAAIRARAIAGALERHLRLPVHMYDERLTTAASERRLIERGLSRRRRREVQDQLAATLLLQDYLDAHQVKGPPSAPREG